MRISKHHYALELADQGCTVYFIEPPTLDTQGVTIRQTDDHPRVYVVTYKPVFRGERFLPAVIFEWLLRRQIRLLVDQIGRKPDVVWCFQSFLFRNLSWFGAPVRIFFLADQFNKQGTPPEVDSASLVLAVSDTIYNRIRAGNKSVFRINHGLQKYFHAAIPEALASASDLPAEPHRTVGYLGNLRIESMDRDAILTVIEAHPELTFIFWGSYKTNELNLGGLQDHDSDRFIAQLEAKSNVQLRGAFHGQELLSQMKEVDLFWQCFKLNLTVFSDGSNSHKMLEYLSTGKPVISQPLSSYKGSDLIYMMSPSDRDFPSFFSATLKKLQAGEDPALSRRRMEFAKDNSYAAQLRRIEEMLTSNPETA